MATDKLIDKYVDCLNAQETINGLLMAQAICSRKMLEAFDKNQQDIVLSIMQEILNKIEEVREACE